MEFGEKIQDCRKIGGLTNVKRVLKMWSFSTVINLLNILSSFSKRQWMIYIYIKLIGWRVLKQNSSVYSWGQSTPLLPGMVLGLIPVLGLVKDTFPQRHFFLLEHVSFASNISLRSFWLTCHRFQGMRFYVKRKNLISVITWGMLLDWNQRKWINVDMFIGVISSCTNNGRDRDIIRNFSVYSC